MYGEDELLAISALQHLAFCERQWGLIHLEQAWEENVLTAQGRLLHNRADSPGRELRAGVLIVRGLRIRSLGLGVSGIADVVEFHPGKDEKPPQGPGPPQEIPLSGRPGLWRPFPVEYKRGRPKRNNCDEIQLCAQAICIEEMLGATIDAGTLFYGKTKRRHAVSFSDELRAETETMAEKLHTLERAGKTPQPEHGPKCESCSLARVCMPDVASVPGRAGRYISSFIRNIEGEGEEAEM